MRSGDPDREAFEALTELVTDDNVRTRKWKEFSVKMHQTRTQGNLHAEWGCDGGPCPIERWIRTDGHDTWFLDCQRCEAIGLTPDEFYEV